MQGRPREEVIRNIREKKNTDYCGMYELYYQEKLKRDCFEQGQSQQSLKLLMEDKVNGGKHGDRLREIMSRMRRGLSAKRKNHHISNKETESEDQSKSAQRMNSVASTGES